LKKLKRFSLLVGLVLGIGSIFTSFAYAQTNSNTVKMDKPKLVALGDSITFGYHLEQNQTKPSPNAFPSLIGNGQFEVTNLGVPGWTAADLLKAVKTNPIFKHSIRSADVITLYIGGNDLLQAAGITQAIQNQTPPALTPQMQQKLMLAEKRYALNLSAIISNIKKQTDAPIIVYNLYNPFGESSDPYQASLHQLGEQIIPAVNTQIIKPITLLTGSSLADSYTAFNGKQDAYIIPGDVHPTLAGHRALAALADNALANLHSWEYPHSNQAIVR
jgi:lysophospholipase L1-like esterase